MTKVTLRAQINRFRTATLPGNIALSRLLPILGLTIAICLCWLLGAGKRCFLITFFATIQCCGKSANAYALQSLISFSYTRRYFTNEQSAMLRVTQIFVHWASQVVGVQLVERGRGSRGKLGRFSCVHILFSMYTPVCGSLGLVLLELSFEIFLFVLHFVTLNVVQAGLLCTKDV